MTLLSRAIARGTLPPTLLFAGPDGVGKRRVAQAIAEVVNCLKPRGPGVVAGRVQGKRRQTRGAGRLRRVALVERIAPVCTWT